MLNLDSMLILRNDYAGSTSYFFDRSWTQYQQGFESPTALYWIGLDRLHDLSRGICQARFDLQLIDGTWYYAQYSSFSVGNASTNYKLTIGGYSGDTGFDTMARDNGQQFTTFDADHDPASNNCASDYCGGFWYGSGCGDAHLTTSNGNFYWYTPTDWMSLNVVEVSLLC